MITSAGKFMWAPSIVQRTLGKLLVAKNPFLITFALSSLGHTIKAGARMSKALTTRPTHFNAVALPTLIFSQIDL